MLVSRYGKKINLLCVKKFVWLRNKGYDGIGSGNGANEQYNWESV